MGRYTHICAHADTLLKICVSVRVCVCFSFHIFSFATMFQVDFLNWVLMGARGKSMVLEMLVKSIQDYALVVKSD